MTWHPSQVDPAHLTVTDHMEADFIAREKRREREIRRERAATRKTSQRKREMTIWQGCYDESWKGLISDESFSHPAKYGRGLIRRIYEYLRDEHGLPPGSIVVDPFGGVANGAVDAMDMGYCWFGVELEKRFAILSHSNITTWLSKGWCNCGGECDTYVRAVREELSAVARRSEQEAKRGKGGAFLWGDVPEEMADWPEAARGAGREPEGPAPVEQGQAVVGSDEAKTFGAGEQRQQVDGKERPLAGRSGVDTGRIHQDPRERTAETGASARHGDTPGAPAKASGTRSPRKRRQDRQSTGEPADSHGINTHEAPQPARAENAHDNKAVPDLREGVFNEATLTEHLPVARLQEIAATALRACLQRKAGSEGTCPACGLKIPDVPIIVNGDSRRLCELLGPLLGEAAVVVGSPPFADSLQTKDVAFESARQAARGRNPNGYGHLGSCSPDAYGTTKGQLGAMTAGSLADAVISSPPYTSETVNNRNGIDCSKLTGPRGGLNSQARTMAGYGNTEGQLGSLPPGALADAVADCVVSSPPYEEGLGHGGSTYAECGQGGHRVKEAMVLGYGRTDGQLGGATGDTFWLAAREIVTKCHQILRPGGLSVWVVKAFVRKGAIVDFPGDWQRLCEACGFELVEEIHASLVKRDEQQGLFGEPVVKTKARKSFFRRLHEAKRPDLAIDYEVVLVMRKNPKLALTT